MPLTLKTKALNISHSFIVALDGTAGVGKGTIGKMLARKFSLEHFSSGLVYRGLAKLLLDQKVDLTDIKAVITASSAPQVIELAQNEDLNDEQIGAIASHIAVIPEVRQALTMHLVKMINDTPRIIMEGRDIGTIVAPQADLKIFLTADLEIRAERRYKQLKEIGKECILAGILDQLRSRDQQDSSRAASPMKAAPDAFCVDTSRLTTEQVMDKIENFIISSS